MRMTHTSFKDILLCPNCGSSVIATNQGYTCSGECKINYPIYFDVPILISPNNPVFNIDDFAGSTTPTLFFNAYKNPILKFLKKIRPDATLNLASNKNYAYISDQLKLVANPRILIIGGSIDGKGIKILKNNLPANTILVESDVTHGLNTNIILDAHKIPFQDQSFDLVISQAVFEHVLDPFLCVKEIHRVLKTGGLIYSEIPFMQHVHGGKYDFHRFTHLGHKRLFRQFREEKSGIIAGAGSMLAWSLLYFITSFSPNKKIDKALSYLGSFACFWLKYFDYFLNQNKGSYDAACGIFFLGKKELDYVLSDQELLSSYRGHKS